MADPLVSLELAKGNLQVVTDDDAALIQIKIQQASDIVRRMLGEMNVDSWTADDVPSPVQNAVLLFVTHFFEDGRGDDMTKDKDLMNAVESVLTVAGYRWIALA